MGKLLPILGIACAVLGLLAALVLVGAATMLVPVVAIVAAVLLFPERSPTGIFAGLAVLALSLVALAGLVSSVNIRGAALEFGIPVDVATALAVCAAVAVPLAVTLSRWDLVAPAWLAWVGVAAAGLAVVLAFVARDQLPHSFSPLPALVGLASLATMAPMIPLLRMDEDGPRAAPPPPA
jgi:hypothetical protein